MLGHRGRGSIQSGDDSSGEEQLRSVISPTLSTMSDHPPLQILSWLNFTEIEKIGMMRELSTFSDGGRGGVFNSFG